MRSLHFLLLCFVAGAVALSMGCGREPSAGTGRGTEPAASQTTAGGAEAMAKSSPGERKDSSQASAASGRPGRGRRPLPAERPEIAGVRTAEEQRDQAAAGASGETKALLSRLSDECAKLPPSGREEIDGLESRGWVREDFGNPGAAFILPAGRLDKRMLVLCFNSGEKDKTGFGRILDLAARDDGKLAMAVYNPSDAPITISIALTTGPDHIWHESKPVELKVGWNAVELALDATDYKTAASGWKYTSAIANKGELRGVFIVVNNARREGHIFVDGITLDTAAPRQSPPPGKTEGPEGKNLPPRTAE
ncbi:MAG: hypothetical protein N3A38_12080 [Planctomycetota bacterium]|nr:hypothetical protein [Planctomycetota bacterium]